MTKRPTTGSRNLERETMGLAAESDALGRWAAALEKAEGGHGEINGNDGPTSAVDLKRQYSQRSQSEDEAEAESDQAAAADLLALCGRWPSSSSSPTAAEGAHHHHGWLDTGVHTITNLLFVLMFCAVQVTSAQC